jgi:hypothetical protein
MSSLWDPSDKLIFHLLNKKAFNNIFFVTILVDHPFITDLSAWVDKQHVTTHEPVNILTLLWGCKTRDYSGFNFASFNQVFTI